MPPTLHSVPDLRAIARKPALARGLPRETLVELLADAAAAHSVLLAEVASPPPGAAHRARISC